MRKLSILLLLSIFSSSILFAQSKDAESILQELSSKTNAYKNIKVSFAYKMSNQSAGIDEVTNGTLLISGDKYNLNIAGQVIISDGKIIWTYIPDSEEVQINEKDEESGFSPSKWSETISA